ncbi:MAG: tetratricopeptide repeat protein [Gammaproteobacteria bacterium]|nr:tetratricopeptide repeat protein [Gammaproteobacteria bacterium]
MNQRIIRGGLKTRLQSQSIRSKTMQWLSTQKDATSLLFIIIGFAISVYSPLSNAEESNFKFYDTKSPYIRAVLFDIYQEKYTSAIGRLISRRYRNNDKEKLQSELLLAHIYISFRMHDDAEKILNALPKRMPSNETRNKNVLWMDIAKAHFRAGDINAAQDTLYKLDNIVSSKLTREREVFQAQILMSQKKYREAVEELENTRGSSDWAAYARYNLGVTLVRLGNEKRGIKKLKIVSRMDSNEPEMKSLKDKANYTLGYIYLKNKNPDKAKSHLQKIRLNSPLANKALMHLGLVYSEMDNHKQSLAAWLTLSQRDPSDSTVLESMLAVPFAFAELGGFDQAVKNYELGIDAYRIEIKHINKVIQSVKKGHTTNAILEQLIEDGAESLDKSDLLPVTENTKYLLGLYESNEFQEAIKNYKDLRSLENKLKKWTFAIYRVGNMSKTFKKVYVDKIALQQSRLAKAAQEMKKHIKKMALETLQNRKNKLNIYIKQAQFATAQIYDKGHSVNSR